MREQLHFRLVKMNGEDFAWKNVVKGKIQRYLSMSGSEGTKQWVREKLLWSERESGVQIRPSRMRNIVVEYI